MNKELTSYNTTLFAEKVLPQLSDLFADHEDHWWPAAATSAKEAAR
jgi:hypothetical protein